MVCPSRIVLCAVVTLLLSVAACVASQYSCRGDFNSGTFPCTPFPQKPSVVWRAHLGEWNIGAQPTNVVLANGMVIAALNKTLYALSAETGELYWQQVMYDKPMGDILLVDGTIVVAHLNGLVRGYHVEDGELAWDVKLSGFLRNGPTIAADAIMLSTKAGTIAGVARDGTHAVREIDVKGSITAAPLPIGNSLVLAYEDGKILQLEKSLSRLITRIPNTKIVYTPASDGKRVLLNTTDGLVLLDATDRTAPVRWSYPTTTRVNDAPAITDKTVYFATASGRLHALDLATGIENWVKTTINVVEGVEVARKEIGVVLPAGAIAHPVVFQDTVIVRMAYGLIGAYAAESGEMQWLYQLPLPPSMLNKEKVETKAQEKASAATASPSVVTSSPFGGVPVPGGSPGAGPAGTGTASRRPGMQRPGVPGQAATAEKPEEKVAKNPTADFVIGTPAVDGQNIYFVGADGSFYRLSSTALDIDPPVIKPVIAKMTVKSGHGIVEAPQVTEVAVLVNDEGSGVDPSSISILIDNKERTAEAVSELAEGKYTLTMPAEAPLTAGLHQLKVTARDQRGNESTLEFDFVVNASASTSVVPIVISSEFLPQNLQVAPGTLVVWQNKSGSPRTVISDTGHFNSDTLHPKGIPNGGTWMWLVPTNAQPGTGYYYHDRLNGKPGNGVQFGKGLTGRLEIIAPSQPAETPVNPGVRPGGVTPGPTPGGFRPTPGGGTTGRPPAGAGASPGGTPGAPPPGGFPSGFGPMPPR